MSRLVVAEPWGRTQVRRQGLLHQEGKYSCLKRERREVQGGHWKQSFPQPFPSTRHAQVSSFPPVVPLFVPFKAGFSEALAAQPILSLRQQQMLLRSFPKSGIDKKKTASQENVRPLSSVLTPPFVLQAETVPGSHLGGQPPVVTGTPRILASALHLPTSSESGLPRGPHPH